MSPEEEWEGFLAKYLPSTAALATSLAEEMRALVPGAHEMVYDNYNFLVLGFGASERPSDAVLSLAVAPRWVSVCFLKGIELDDPAGVLTGEGNQVRSIRLHTRADIRRPEVVALIHQAVARSTPPFDPGRQRTMVVRSVSAKQRPRRPKD